MLKTLRNALKIEDIRNRLKYTLLMLIVIRLGSLLPLPGVDPTVITNFFNTMAGSGGPMTNMLDMLTGGAFERMSIFALSISPYITSSIIMQLLTIAIPKLEEMQKDGEEGRKKIQQLTRYVTVALALIEALAMSIGFGQQGLFENFNFVNVSIAVVALTAGSAFLMWIGESITEKGVGNGISIILLVNIVSRIPTDFITLYDRFMKGKKISMAVLAVAIIIVVILLTVVLVLILNGGERKIPVQYAKKMQGRKMVGGQSTHIPLKVNTAGVIPIIFTSSIMSFPSVIAAFLGKDPMVETGFGYRIIRVLNQQNWFNMQHPRRTIGLLIYLVLVVFFSYFYTSITFNPIEVADNMKKQGGFVPGIRPGKPTTEHLTRILNYIIFIGAAGLIFVAIVPIFFNGMFGAMVSFGGTSIIIIVGVILETMKQIESLMLVRYYKGFLND
jgi:preprotein translocase, SecY subunit